MKRLRSVPVTRLLLAVNLVLVALPLGLLIVMRLFETYLIQRTEARLISECVMTAEIWRADILNADDVAMSDKEIAFVHQARAADSSNGYGGYDSEEAPQVLEYDGVFAGPRLTRANKIYPDNNPPPACPETRNFPKMDTILNRAQRYNLSAVSIVDTNGCIISGNAHETGVSLKGWQEVREALAGRYHSLLRGRGYNTTFGIGRQRAAIFRVYVAYPIYKDGVVVGAVSASRTPAGLVEGLWSIRKLLLIFMACCLILVLLISYFFARVITRPTQVIMTRAKAIADGERPAVFAPGGLMPSELVDLGQSLDKLTRELADRANYNAEFAANVNHELKTPIASIRATIELLRDSIDHMSPEQRDRFLANMDDASTRMQSLVSSLLYLARIEHSEHVAGAVSLNSFLAELAERKGPRVIYSDSETPVQCRISEDHLRSAVENLLDNALRHSGDKPVDMMLTLSPGYVQITVRDQGPGIGENNREKIFDRFFTTERERGGAGLGLSIVKAVMDRYQGSVAFETGPKGTSFTLQFHRV